MTNKQIRMTKKYVGEVAAGKVACYRFSNKNGMEVEILNYGGIIKSIKVPDRKGQLEDVVLGYDTLEGYLENLPFFGAIIGRYGNRIAKGQFSINGTTYQLPINNGPNTLHGGIKGFDKVLWTANALPNGGVQLTYLSPDKEEGFPGNLTVQVRYTLDDNNALSIHYKATTDQPTVCNLTNHSYFNLQGKGDVLDHQLQIDADYITPVDETLIPKGRYRKVKGTAFDFRTAKRIGQDIDKKSDDQLQIAAGYDHNFILNKDYGSFAAIATVVEPLSGRRLDVFTTEPGVQLYTANTFDGIVGKGGVAYGRRCGFCLETQHFPDSPNQAIFPSTLLLPEEEYLSCTVYRFAVG